MNHQKPDSKFFNRRTLFSATGIISLSAGLFLLNKEKEKQDNRSSTAPKDMNGNSIQLDEPLTGTDIEKMSIEPTENRLIIENLGLNSPISTMNSIDGVINPPDATSAYLLRDYGTTLNKPLKGAIYAVAHSLKSGIGPGNYLFDWQNDKILVKEKDLIEISNLQYEVSRIDLTDKTKIGEHETIWDNEPGKLVFITCLQRAQGRSLKNLIVEADLKE